ncbi:uncharacterized protein At4g04775-like [Raphanus sativus]|uniref:Uncharacterized protein At4g04775-like n=1 Tax=Raphanus sativus TaxID=3726 RepID=A0A6J0P1M0_RAPSA|nr:uncharacterized protein At4g04775-like [Raphanus sativus]
MSDESGNSTGTSAARARGRVVGVPKRCWCGELVVTKMSKSVPNPYRRYYRCAFAAERKLSNDNHAYKWVDEALLDEIEALTFRVGRLERTLIDDRVEEERKKFAEFEMKLETEVFSRMEDAISEAKWEMKKVMGIVALGCLTMVVLSKII